MLTHLRAKSQIKEGEKLRESQERYAIVTRSIEEKMFYCNHQVVDKESVLKKDVKVRASIKYGDNHKIQAFNHDLVRDLNNFVNY